MGYSKDKQDEWVMKHIFNYKKGGFYVDVGAYDGVKFSNTKLLEDKYGWKGICIEANDKYYKTLIKKRSSKSNKFINACLWDVDGEEVEFIDETMASGIRNYSTRWNEDRLAQLQKEHTILKKKTKSLVSVLDKCKSPKHIDFISIDAEGSEEKIINPKLLEKYSFSCILVEVYKECFPDENIPEYPKTTVHNVLQNAGYVVKHKLGECEYFYVPKV